MAAVPIVPHGYYDLPLVVADRLPEADAGRLFLHAGAFAVLTAGIGFALVLLGRVRAIQATPAGGHGFGRHAGGRLGVPRRGLARRQAIRQGARPPQPIAASGGDRHVQRR